MGFIRILLLVLTNLPELIKLIRDIIDLIEMISDGDSSFDKKAALRELHAAAKTAKHTKSPKDLERIRQELMDRAQR